MRPVRQIAIHKKGINKSAAIMKEAYGKNGKFCGIFRADCEAKELLCGRLCNFSTPYLTLFVSLKSYHFISI